MPQTSGTPGENELDAVTPAARLPSGFPLFASKHRRRFDFVFRLDRSHVKPLAQRVNAGECGQLLARSPFN